MSAHLKDHDIIGVIARSPWFECLPHSAHDRLAAAGKIRSYAKNSYLFNAGDLTDDVFCLLSGRVRLLMTSTIGQAIAITDLMPEAWFNETAITGDVRHMLDARARESATVLLIPNSVIIDIGKEFPQMYEDLLRDYVVRARGFFALLQSMAFYPLKSRLAGWMLRLIEEHGEKKERGVSLDIQLTQDDLAQLSQGSRQRINKILGEWRDRGILEIEGCRYLIRDVDALTAEKKFRNPDT